MMILRKEKKELIKANKTRNIKGNKNEGTKKKENFYLKSNNIKNEQIMNPQIRNINDILRKNQKENKNGETQFKKNYNNNTFKASLTEPENNPLLYRNSNNQIKNINNLKKKINSRNKQYKNLNDNIIINNDNYNNKVVKYDKTENNNNRYRTPLTFMILFKGKIYFIKYSKIN